MARILLVEPDRLLAKTYAKSLRQAGHAVTCCLTGQAAIQAADRQTPDAIVLELQLKGHNGVEFLYELRSYPEWQDLPVVVNTLVPEQSLHSIATVPLLHINAYLYKPNSSLAKLLEAVNDAVRQAVQT